MVGFVLFSNTELMFSWLRFTLSISGVTGVGMPVPKPSLYNTCEVQESFHKKNHSTQATTQKKPLNTELISHLF